jgi:hypothetical protein
MITMMQISGMKSQKGKFAERVTLIPSTFYQVSQTEAYLQSP